VTPVLLPETPMAMHAPAETQDTPLRRLLPVTGLGLGSTDHGQDERRLVNGSDGLLSLELAPWPVRRLALCGGVCCCGLGSHGACTALAS